MLLLLELRMVGTYDCLAYLARVSCAAARSSHVVHAHLYIYINARFQHSSLNTSSAAWGLPCPQGVQTNAKGHPQCKDNKASLRLRKTVLLTAEYDLALHAYFKQQFKIILSEPYPRMRCQRKICCGLAVCNRCPSRAGAVLYGAVMEM